MTMRLLLPVLVALAGWGCSASSGPTASPTAPTTSPVVSVVITGGAALGAPGQTSQLTAIAGLSNGTTQDVSASAIWESSDPSVATVTRSGMVTAVAPGQLLVSATYQGRTASLPLNISFSTSPSNVLTATIDGALFVGSMVSVLRGPGRISIGGSSLSGGTHTMLFLSIPETVGTYPAPPSQFTPGASAFLGTMALPATGRAPAPPALWGILFGTGGGTITLSSLTSSTATGTFSLTLAAVPGSTAMGTRTVTTGAFDVRF